MDIEEIVTALVDAWNGADSDAWAAVFTEDAVFVDVLGRVQSGRAVIAAEHRKILDTIYRGSRLAVRVQDVRTLGDGIVLAHTTSELSVPDGPRAGVTGAIQTKVVRDGLVAAFQNTIRTDMAGFTGGDADLAARNPLGWGGPSVRA